MVIMKNMNQEKITRDMFWGLALQFNFFQYYAAEVASGLTERMGEDVIRGEWLFAPTDLARLAKI